MLINEVNVDNVVLEDYKEPDSVFNGRYNKTSLFALPFLGMSVTSATSTKYLRNAFIDDRGIEHDFEHPLFLLFSVKNQKDKVWIDFCKTLTKSEIYVTDYYVGVDAMINHLIMFVFKVPEKWVVDFEFFKAGRYSKMSDAYKVKFAQYTYSASGTKRETKMWGILNKSDALKDEIVKTFIVPETSTKEDVINLRREMDGWDEIWDAPQPYHEIFLYNK